MKQGGKRKGSGRKPIEDKVKPVTIYIKQSQLNLVDIDLLKDRLKSTVSQIIAQI